MPAEINHYKR